MTKTWDILWKGVVQPSPNGRGRISPEACWTKVLLDWFDPNQWEYHPGDKGRQDCILTMKAQGFKVVPHKKTHWDEGTEARA